MRKALKATGLSFRVPLQISVVPPDATAISPRFLSPCSNPMDLGSSPVSLEISPNAAMSFGSFRRLVGAAFPLQCSEVPVLGPISRCCQLRTGDTFNDNTNLINDFQQHRLFPHCQLPYHWDITLELQKCLKLWSTILPRGRAAQQPTACFIRVPAGRDGGFFGAHGGGGLRVAVILTVAVPSRRWWVHTAVVFVGLKDIASGPVQAVVVTTTDIVPSRNLELSYLCGSPLGTVRYTAE